MSRRAGDACLAALSALLTSFTFEMRGWTGISSSREWPLIAAVLLMVVWLVVQRRHGIRTTLLLASLIGIGAGLTAGLVWHRLEIGKPLGLLLLVTPAMAGTCLGLYLWAEKQERRGAAEIASMTDRIKRDYEEIKALPPDQAAVALRAHFGRLQDEYKAHSQEFARMERKMAYLVGAAVLLTLATLPAAFRPEPRPLLIVLNAFILLLCLVWFGFIVLARRTRRKLQAPPE